MSIAGSEDQARGGAVATPAKKILVIANPQAGGGNSEDFIAELASDPTLVVRKTEGPGEGRALAYEAALNGFDVVAAAGGDGTIHAVALGLHEAGGSAALAVLPLGTGNDLVRSLNLNDRERALRVMRAGERRPLDLLRVTLDDDEPRMAVNAIVAGMGGRVSEELDEETKASWGPLSYLRKAVEMVADPEPFRAELSVDDVALELEVLNLVVANGRFAGRGIPIAPGADPFDGWLDVAVVRNAPLRELTRLAPSFFKQEDPDDDLFLTDRGRRVTVNADRLVPFSIDGEVFSARRASFEILEGALDVQMATRDQEGDI